MKTNNLKVTEFKQIAANNLQKAAADLAIGDFIFCAGSSGKDNDLFDWYRMRKRMEKDREIKPTLCKIVDVIDVTDDYDMLNNWMDRPAPTHRGGSESQDIPEDKELYNLTKAEIATFYQLVTIFRNSRGQWIAVDCQGYDYWRYVYMPVNYASLFENEILDVEIKIMMDQARRAYEEEQELNAHAEAYAARLAELRAQYPELKEKPDNTRAIVANVRKYINKHLPGLKFKISGRKSSYRSSAEITVKIPVETPAEIREKISAISEQWKELMLTGEISDCEIYSGPTELHANPMANLFGAAYILIGYIR